MDEEKKEENEANYQKRVDNMEKKDAQKNTGDDDWFNNIKTFGTDA